MAEYRHSARSRAKSVAAQSTGGANLRFALKPTKADTRARRLPDGLSLAVLLAVVAVTGLLASVASAVRPGSDWGRVQPKVPGSRYRGLQVDVLPSVTPTAGGVPILGPKRTLDTFDRSTLGPWRSELGAWSMSGSHLVAQPRPAASGLSVIVLGSASPGSIAVRVRRGDVGGPVVRYRGREDYWSLRLRPEARQVELVWRRKGTDLPVFATPLPAGDPIGVGLRSRSRSIEVIVSGRTVARVHTPPGRTGRVGLVAGTGRSAFGGPPGTVAFDAVGLDR